MNNEEIARIEKDPEDNLVLSIKYTAYLKPGREERWYPIAIRDRLKRVILKTLYDKLMNMEPNNDIEVGIMDALKTMKSFKTEKD